MIDKLSPAPVACECLMGCEALGLMGVRECYVADNANASLMGWVRGCPLRHLQPLYFMRSHCWQLAARHATITRTPKCTQMHPRSYNTLTQAHSDI